MVKNLKRFLIKTYLSHNPFNGGYYPVGLSFEESNKLMATDKETFKKMVQQRYEVDIL